MVAHVLLLLDYSGHRDSRDHNTYGSSCNYHVLLLLDYRGNT